MATNNRPYEDEHFSFIKEAEVFMGKHKLSVTTFGRLIMNDPGGWNSIRNGRILRTATIATFRSRMVEYEKQKLEQLKDMLNG